MSSFEQRSAAAGRSRYHAPATGAAKSLSQEPGPAPAPLAARVIYVAQSVREFPQEVQGWLSQPDNQARPSPGIYDTLALLAMGGRPAAIVVSIDAVDWNELEFFDHCARMSPRTQLYVAGSEHQRAKIEAARARGARPFDPDSLGEDLSAPVEAARPVGPSSLLAGSLRPLRPVSKDASPATPFPRKAVEPDEDRPAVERPAVRLVTPTDDEDLDRPVPIPVPWAPSPDRPKRTPPKRAPRNDDSPAAPEAARVQSVAPDESARTRQQHLPVELTAEELAALLGKSAETDPGSAKGQRR